MKVTLSQHSNNFSLNLVLLNQIRNAFILCMQVKEVHVRQKLESAALPIEHEPL